MILPFFPLAGMLAKSRVYRKSDPAILSVQVPVRQGIHPMRTFACDRGQNLISKEDCRLRRQIAVCAVSQNSKEQTEAMMPEQRYWWRIALELKLRKSSGDAFQDFSMMATAHGSDFVRVRGFGTLGDKGCDGYEG
jgi:hypothetical protein